MPLHKSGSSAYLCLQELQSLSCSVTVHLDASMWVQSVTLYVCMFNCVHREKKCHALRRGTVISSHIHIDQMLIHSQ